MRRYYWAIILYIVSTKTIVNVEGDVQGDFKASYEAYLVAGVTLLFVCLVVFGARKDLMERRKTSLVTIAFRYYHFAFFLAVFSLLPAVSLFRSIHGIGFVLAGLAIGEVLLKSKEGKVESFYNLLQVVLWTGIIANIIYSVLYVRNFSIFNLQAGYAGLICAYLGLWHLIDYLETKKKSDLYTFIFFTLLTSMLHSFSAYISLFVALTFLARYKKKYLLTLVLLLTPLFTLGGIINYLVNNPSATFLGKPGGAYLIGSGRFEVYASSLDAFMGLGIFEMLKGVGFMAERNLLSVYDLTWSSDPHNSFISSVLGLGIIGGLFYLVFAIAPFRFKKKFEEKVGKTLTLKWILMHVMFLVYGFTSSSYMATPTFQLLLFITFSHLVSANLNTSNYEREIVS